MTKLQLGIVAESLGLPFRSVLEQAARMAVHGLQINAIGEFAPDQLGGTGRRELRTLLRSYNLELSALACPLRRGLDSFENQQPRLEQIQKVMQLAYDLGVGRVVMPFPKLLDATAKPALVLRESLTVLAAAGDRMGTLVCLEAGLDDGKAIREYLDTYDTGSLQVNFDPANFLINGFDPLACLTALQGRIAHTHARDAKAATISGRPQEVPLGAGDIDWMLYIATLESIDYRGYLTIEQETGNNRLAEIAAGVRFLKKFIPVVER